HKNVFPAATANGIAQTLSAGVSGVRTEIVNRHSAHVRYREMTCHRRLCCKRNVKLCSAPLPTRFDTIQRDSKAKQRIAVERVSAERRDGERNGLRGRRREHAAGK